jgi:hypothetical protein
MMTESLLGSLQKSKSLAALTVMPRTSAKNQLRTDAGGGQTPAEIGIKRLVIRLEAILLRLRAGFSGSD